MRTLLDARAPRAPPFPRRAAAIVEEVASRAAAADMVYHAVKALALRVRCCQGDVRAAESARARLAAALRRWRGTPEQINDLFRDRDGALTLDASQLLAAA